MQLSSEFYVSFFFEFVSAYPCLSIVNELSLKYLCFCLFVSLHVSFVLVPLPENGEIIRETMRDTDSINLYKSMRECLVYLTNLDPVDTQGQMLGKLALQIDGSGMRAALGIGLWLRAGG